MWAFSDARFGLGVGLGAMAAVSYFIAPVETPPQYGLDHGLSVASDEFLTSMTGATGAQLIDGNSLAILNNGDEFYPAMLGDIRSAELSITIEAYIYWAGGIGLEFARALAERARAGVRVKILLDAVGSSDIGDEIVRELEAAGCQIAWYNPIRWYTLGRFNHRTHRSRSSSTAAWRIRAGRGLRTTGSGTRRTPITGATSRFASRARRSRRCRPAFRRTGSRPRAS